MAAGDAGSSEKVSSPEKLDRQSQPELGKESTITPQDQQLYQHIDKHRLAPAQNMVNDVFPKITISSDQALAPSSTDRSAPEVRSNSSTQTKPDTGVVGGIKPPDSLVARADSHNLGGHLKQAFSLVDQNHDGLLTRQEVNFAVQDSSFTGTNAQALTALKWQFNKLTDLHQGSPEGVSLEDIDRFQQLEQSHGKKDTGSGDTDHRVIKGVEGAFNATRLSQRLSQGDLYGGKEVKDSIKTSAVEQGTAGDCYFMASIASLAATNPETIAQMIHDDGINAQGKHTYTVTFPGGEEPITIEAPTASELTLYGHATTYGTWPAVLEKAYGEYRRQHVGWFESKKPQDLPAAEVVGEGGQSDGVLELLTGNDYTYHTMMFSNSESLHKQLSQSFHPADNTDQPTSATPATLAMTSDRDPFGFGLKGPHEYSVVGYDPEKQQVTLRDPRGQGYEPRYASGEVIPWMKGSEPGTFTMTLDEVKATFARIHISTQADV